MKKLQKSFVFILTVAVLFSISALNVVAYDYQ